MPLAARSPRRAAGAARRRRPEVVDALNRGESHIEDVPSDRLAPLVDDGRLSRDDDYDELRDADAILIALPTPLSQQREPDLSIVSAPRAGVAKRLREGQLVVLESTTWPGTTREMLQPILEASGLKAGEDFHLAFSPERVDPGRDGLDDEDDAEGRRRDHARVHRPRRRALPARDRHGAHGLDARRPPS